MSYKRQKSVEWQEVPESGEARFGLRRAQIAGGWLVAAHSAEGQFAMVYVRDRDHDWAFESPLPSVAAIDEERILASPEAEILRARIKPGMSAMQAIQTLLELSQQPKFRWFSQTWLDRTVRDSLSDSITHGQSEALIKLALDAYPQSAAQLLLAAAREKGATDKQKPRQRR